MKILLNKLKKSLCTKRKNDGLREINSIPPAPPTKILKEHREEDPRDLGHPV